MQNVRRWLKMDSAVSNNVEESSNKAFRSHEEFLTELRLEIRQLADPDEIMRRSAQRLAEYLGADRCAYANVENEATFIITGDFCRGVPSIVGRWEVSAFGSACEGQMRSGEPYVVEDTLADPRIESNLAAYEATTIRSVICVPLHKDKRFTAAMAVHQLQPRHWSKEEVELVRSVAAGCWESLERARGERKLEETSHRLGLALMAAELGDWSWEPGSDVVIFSSRAAEIFGIPEDPPMTWTTMQGLIEEEDRGGTLAILAKALALKEHYDAEYRVNRPDGSQVWISAKGRAHYNPDGDPTRMYGVVQDITKRKRMEEQLLVNVAKLAEADRKKDDFIALLAHELRNPLAPLRTGLEIVRCSSGDVKVVEKVIQMLDSQLSLMTRLIDDLLDVSRITEGKVTLKMQRLPVQEVVEEVLNMMTAQFEAAQLELVVEIDQRGSLIMGDRVRLVQVLSNLLTNSIKFTEAGGVVKVKVRMPGDKVEIVVEDTGTGIPSEILPHVFEKFVQAAPGSSKGGLGLGLSLARSLVELHGGQITAESGGLGKGSRFRISLPAVL